MTFTRGVLALAGAALVAASFARFGVSGRGFVAAFVVAVLAVVSVFDLEHPNRIVLPAAAVVLGARIALSPGRTVEWVVAAAGAAGFLLLAHLVYRRGWGWAT